MKRRQPTHPHPPNCSLSHCYQLRNWRRKGTRIAASTIFSFGIVTRLLYVRPCYGLHLERTAQRDNLTLENMDYHVTRRSRYVSRRILYKKTRDGGVSFSISKLLDLLLLNLMLIVYKKFISPILILVVTGQTRLTLYTKLNVVLNPFSKKRKKTQKISTMVYKISHYSLYNVFKIGYFSMCRVLLTKIVSECLHCIVPTTDLYLK
jgi:hypothetical protein